MNIKEIIKGMIGYDGSCFQKEYRNYKNKKKHREKKRLMDAVGLELLENLFNTAKKCNVSIWLEFGTLLGAYRNKDFISHDLDIDTGMYADEYTLRFEDELLDKGFKKRRAFYQKNVATGEVFLTEVTFEFSGFTVDIFFSFKNGNNQRDVFVYGLESKELADHNVYNVRNYEFPIVEHLEKVEIRNKIFNAPNDPENTLKVIYGDNFMIPDPSWDTTKSRLNVKIFPVKERYANKKGAW